ncbi:hypothetical protein [Parasegetibacter sp. NRK P23]|uniref:hypothetical protein n=1 Tax=Parasegetibacter sp. NRK P23 TaxID=2942999 RepID=UPI002044753C|nr:hypothetical protein [Parasegetibacter sp. NRK P23]MCM5527457.1 hypothetical protein [Parasegetibacter sp. NRK P23]
MNPYSTSTSRKIAVAIALLGVSLVSKAQLKVGDNPTSIHKSSILELESTRQGLLLPRLADTTQINGLTPPDGMIIYLNSDKSLRLRSNGSWKKIADLSEATSNWSLSGNSGTNPATQFLGTVDGQPLVIRTDNNERMRIDANGNVGIGTNNPTAKLEVDGSVKLQGIAAGSTELDVLVLNADGSVYKRTISSSSFENAIKAINNIQAQTLSFTAETSLSEDSVKVENRSADSTIALYLPVQNGSSASKPYGMLTYADWQKIQSSMQTLTIGTVASSSNVNGASIVSDSTSRQIILHPADATNAGIVSVTAQTFAGNKTFQDSVSASKAILVGATGAANSTVEVQGSIAMAIKTVTASYTATAADNTILANTSSSSITLTLPAPSAFSGRIYTIKKIGNGGIDRELVITPSSGTIDGGNSYTIYNDWTYVTLQTNGTDWFIIKK